MIAGSSPSGTDEAARTQILLVCRANRCRSPFAQAIATRLGATRGLRFESAGLLPGGHPTPSVGRAVAHGLGFDLDHHLSKQVDVEALDRYDLVLTMARDHARDLLIERDDIRARLFTLKQFARWAPTHPRPPRTAVGPWLDIVAADRPRRDLVGADVGDDIADPLASPPRAWRRMARELDEHLRTTVHALAGCPARGRPDGGGSHSAASTSRN